MGCLKIKMAHLWPLTHFVWEASAKFVGSTFFCYDLEGWRKHSLVRIEIFRLPTDQSHFDERVEWYTRDRKKRRIKIADGQLFEEDFLHLKAFGESWEKYAFAISKGEVIRIYKTKKHAIIFRFFIQNGTFLQHPVFKRLIKNIAIEPAQWTREVPEVIEKTRKKSRVEEWAFSDDQTSEMWQLVGKFLKEHKLQRLKAVERMSFIETKIEEARENKLSKEERIEFATEFGTFAGQVFCWEFDWEWGILCDSKGNEDYCVCSPDRRVALAPIDWIFELISSKRRALNCVLTYNLVQSGRLPPSRANAYKRIC